MGSENYKQDEEQYIKYCSCSYFVEFAGSEYKGYGNSENQVYDDLALPFAMFAFFPSMLKEIPRSGGWLNSVKVVLGFVELILSLKFLSVADLAYGWHILDREVFLAIWIVLFALLGMYLPLRPEMRLPPEGCLLWGLCRKMRQARE